MPSTAHTGQRDKFRGSVSFEIAAMSFEIAPSSEVEPGKIKVIGDDLRQKAASQDATEDDITAYTNFITKECNNCTDGENGCIDPGNREDLRKPEFFGQKIWRDGDKNCYFNDTVKGITDNGVFKSPITRNEFETTGLVQRQVANQPFFRRMITGLSRALFETEAEQQPARQRILQNFLNRVNDLVNRFENIKRRITDDPNMEEGTFHSYRGDMQRTYNNLTNLMNQAPENLLPSDRDYINEKLNEMNYVIEGLNVYFSNE